MNITLTQLHLISIRLPSRRAEARSSHLAHLPCSAWHCHGTVPLSSKWVTLSLELSKLTGFEMNSLASYASRSDLSRPYRTDELADSLRDSSCAAQANDSCADIQVIVLEIVFVDGFPSESEQCLFNIAKCSSLLLASNQEVTAMHYFAMDSLTQRASTHTKPSDGL
jgi:hypothetical protein